MHQSPFIQSSCPDWSWRAEYRAMVSRRDEQERSRTAIKEMWRFPREEEYHESWLLCADRHAQRTSQASSFGGPRRNCKHWLLTDRWGFWLYSFSLNAFNLLCSLFTPYHKHHLISLMCHHISNSLLMPSRSLSTWFLHVAGSLRAIPKQVHTLTTAAQSWSEVQLSYLPKEGGLASLHTGNLHLTSLLPGIWTRLSILLHVCPGQNWGKPVLSLSWWKDLPHSRMEGAREL